MANQITEKLSKVGRICLAVPRIVVGLCQMVPGMFRIVRKLQADKTNLSDGSDAVAALSEAQSLAASTGRKIFLSFRSSWCIPCYALHKALHDPEIEAVMTRYFVLLSFCVFQGDANPGAAELFQKYGGGEGVPYFVALDEDGKLLDDFRINGEQMGFPGATPERLSHFLKVLRSLSERMTAEEAQKLRVRLEQVADEL